jgi:tRNA A58 N-methylase Trm61
VAIVENLFEPLTNKLSFAKAWIDEFPTTEVLDIDNRETVIEVSRNKIEKCDLSNVAFETTDMREYIKTIGLLPEMIVPLYSFHHIPDPLQQKVKFLKNCYATIPDGGRSVSLRRS